MRAKLLISGCVFGSILTGGAAKLSAQNGTLTDIENGAPLVSADVLGNGGTTTLTHGSGQFTISLAPGVDIIQHGAQSTNIVLRGFNNMFSGALYALVDNRITGVPSLRVELLHWIPTTNDDLERIEVVPGPGSALYGPNTANGVVHMITTSSLESHGASVTLDGGHDYVIPRTWLRHLTYGCCQSPPVSWSRILTFRKPRRTDGGRCTSSRNEQDIFIAHTLIREITSRSKSTPTAEVVPHV